jgi:hypothetical protein
MLPYEAIVNAICGGVKAVTRTTTTKPPPRLGSFEGGSIYILGRGNRPQKHKKRKAVIGVV